MTYIPPGKIRVSEALERFVREAQGDSLHDLDEEAQDRAARPFRDMLAVSHLKSWLWQEEEGYEVEIPSDMWGGRRIWADGSIGMMVTIEANGRWANGYALVSEAQFEGILQNLPQILPVSSLAISESNYVPPYLRYMLELVERFDLEPGYKFDKEKMQEWILNNPDRLPMSKEKAQYMATFLGDPQFEGGGSHKHKWSSQRRPPDPCASYKDVTYPKLLQKR